MAPTKTRREPRRRSLLAISVASLATQGLVTPNHRAFQFKASTGPSTPRSVAHFRSHGSFGDSGRRQQDMHPDYVLDLPLQRYPMLLENCWHLPWELWQFGYWWPPPPP
eukprot:symbB.v1.2.019345.t1/scaffold1578.1/size215304/6